MRIRFVLFVFLLSCLRPPGSAAQDIPFVYRVENTGVDCNLPPLPSLADLPVIRPLTDPFEWSSGSGHISDLDDWRRRRAEIKAEIEHYEIGPKPDRPKDITADYANGTLTVKVTVKGNTLTLTSRVTLPDGEGPFPALIGIGFGPGSGSLPPDIFTNRRIALIPFNFMQVMAHQQKRGQEPINKLYPDLAYMGAYSAWSWGISRLIDGLELVADDLRIDLTHLGVTGCSFAGKMALFAGAFDERIALTISQESGGGGAAAWRVSETLGNVETLGRTDHGWFIEDMFQFSNAVDKLPHDHHELMAMVAPRALLVLGNPDYTWLADESGYVSCRAAHEVWKAFGIPERFGFSIVGGHGHCQLPDSQRPEVEAFVDAFLLGDPQCDTNVTVHPYEYVDYQRWIEWWGTGKPTLSEPNLADMEFVWLEAELGMVGSDWDVVDDAQASNGKYVTVKAGTQSLSAAPTGNQSLITIPFTVQKAGSFSVFARLNCPTADDDSLWVKMDNGEFQMHNGLGTSAWEWKRLTHVKLSAGDHTLTIGYREDGAQLDKICVSNTPYTPEGMGEEAQNSGTAPDTPEKLRVIMMSDFPPINVVTGGNVPNNQKSDPDDMQSMVRFLLYANEFDVEGLVATAGTFAMEAHKKHMLDVLDRYEKVHGNLKKHDPDYPTADYLRSVTYEGLGNNHGLSIKWGGRGQSWSDIIGQGKDSEASNAIIAAVDKPDPRPLWIGVWGGPREVAQAIWDVQNTRSEEELKVFISKLRVFLIAYQDATHGWLMNEFPDLFIIDSRKTYQGMFGGRDPISNLAWVNENIRHNHGPLCDVYPHEGMGCTGVCEGDSPTFLHLVSANRGINNPEDPTQPSWGGQYKRKANTNHYVDGPGPSSIARWRRDYQKEFAERADWCVGATPVAAPTAAPTAPSTATATAVFAVNCGGGSYTSSDGTVYAADTGYSGGLTYSNSESISGTTDDTLYHSERYGDCTYSAAVPNGRYRVILHFAETFHPEAGLRSFDVRVEGTEPVSDLDLYAKAGGNAAYVVQADVTVSDGELNIEFVTDLENAKINAIKVSPVGSGAACGTSASVSPANPTVSPAKSTPVQNETPEPRSAPIRTKTRMPIGYKPRIINTTDLGADPDDEQSMVRFLVCANEFETEGLIVSTGCWKTSQSNTRMLEKILDAYAEVYDNLKVHADGYPTPEYLKSISVVGQRGYGMSDVGSGKDSPGSEMIIAAVDKDDPRPVWVGGWGGVNNVAQAVWKVRETRSEAQLKKFISKLRVFDILGQDDAGAWLAKNFPDLFYIRATGVYGWQPPKNGSYQREDIQSHGPLGAVYPNTKWATEGDTPAFMHVYPNGLHDPDQIDQGGWGGRFSLTKKRGIRSMSGVTRIRRDGETRFDPYYMYGNTPDKAGAIKRWSKGYNNDFQARMDWTMTSDYSRVNHHPVAVVNGDKTRQVLEVSASPGSSVALSAAGSSDPDGDALVYAWSFYKDPSSYNGSVSIENKSSESASVTIPSNAGGKNIHIILELHDVGSPNLYAYRRVIINVK